MGVDINWGLAPQPQNLVSGFVQSYQAGRQMGQDQARANALAAYGQNPNDANALSRLMSVDPQTGIQMQRAHREQEVAQREEAQRKALAGSFDPATGNIDPTKARAAYAQSGDVAGAMQFDQTAAKQRGVEIDTLHKVNEYGLALLGGVTDQASYDRARSAAQQLYSRYSIPFPDLPPNYSPTIVEALRARSLSTKDQIEMTMARAKFEEEQRHNRAGEGVAASNAATAKGRLALGQRAEARSASGKSPVAAMSTADLLKLAGEN